MGRMEEGIGGHGRSGILETPLAAGSRKDGDRSQRTVESGWAKSGV